MVVKFREIIIFNKWVSFMFLFLVSILMVGLASNFFIQFDQRYNNFISLGSFFFSLSVVKRRASLIFTLIVLPVTLLVLSYRKIYIDHYNNKKFLVVTIIFFTSMIILTTRGSIINFMVGWDGLGLTSIALIIFYPNKTALYNSILTIFFNRLGDVFLILSIALIISFYREKIIWFFYSPICGFLLLICAFSKRAQFPLSRWLPAAISAPTPISAIVHSSTLVTAGIFLLAFIEEPLYELKINFIPLVIGISTFIIGGLMANLEKDFKKVVAFSTIRQISMMVRFCFLLRLRACFFHISLHAFFKTILFVSCGRLFLTNYRTQLKKNLRLKERKRIFRVMFYISVFFMTGLIFSSSFYRKDLVIEVLLRKSTNFRFLILFLGRILTLIYCSLIISSVKRWTRTFSTKEKKKPNSIGLIFFAAIIMLSPFIFRPITLLEAQPILMKEEVFFPLIIFFFRIFLSLKIRKLFPKLVARVFLIKDYSYSVFENVIMKEKSKRRSVTDLIVFKPSLFEIKTTKSKTFKISVVWARFLTVLLIVVVLYSFSLNRTWCWSYQGDRINFKI